MRIEYHYDPAGRLLNRILSNGAQTDYRYDDDGRLVQLTNRSADNTLVEALSYQHDALGNSTDISDSISGRTLDYDYDALYRLILVDSSLDSEDRVYTYDKVGNRQTLSENATTYYYCYHATDCSQPPTGNRLINLRTGSLTGPLYRQFAYDDSGRVTGKQDGAGNPMYSVSYNGKGRASGINSHQFAYDANDYRIQKDSKLYHLEGEHLEATYSSAGILQARYLRGVVVDEIVNGYHHHSSDPNDWTNYSFHHDQLNSVTALTGHTGTTEETTQFDAFGKPLNLTIPGTGNDLLYTGREYDRATQLYYYRARYYDPEIGRFISEDPLGFGAGINFYAYVGNNPINNNDPTGLLFTPETVWDAANIGLGSYSLTNNIRGGNYGWAAVDALGLAYDTVATVIPFLPAGASAGLNAGRAGNSVANSVNIGMDVARTADISNTAARNSTAVVTTGLGAAHEGRRIHNEVGNALDAGNLLSDSATNAFRGANGATGIQPDLFWQGSGFWADLTTPGQWAQHVTDYSPTFGQGIPLIYERGNGITNSSSLLPFAGVSLFGAQQATTGFDSQSAGGGFVLYPSRPNTNMMQSVYSK